MKSNSRKIIAIFKMFFILCVIHPLSAYAAEVTEEEYERAVEKVLGVQLEAIQGKRRTNSKMERAIYYEYNLSTAYSFNQIRPDGLASFVTEGNVLLYLNGTKVTDPDKFRQLTIGFICGQLDTIELGMLRPMPFSHPRNQDYVISSPSALKVPSNICDPDTHAPANQYEKYRLFSAYLEYSVDGTITKYHIRSHEQENYSNRLDLFRDVQQEISSSLAMHENCRKGCELHLHDPSDDSTLGKYFMTGYPGSMLYYELGKYPNENIIRDYGYDALAFIFNLSVGDVELIKLTSRYQQGIARLYYWFGLKYGDQCQANIKNIGEVRLKTITTETSEFGNSRVINEDESVYPVENSFVARVVDYGNWYVFGMAEYKVSSGVSQFIRKFGCTSTPVSNVRKNLLRFGLAHKKINSKQGF